MTVLELRCEDDLVEVVEGHDPLARPQAEEVAGSHAEEGEGLVMGQKIRPTGFRVGITDDWRSRWYAKKKDFGLLLVEDQKVREFVKKEYGFAGIPRGPKKPPPDVLR